jgi:hypothetical protein
LRLLPAPARTTARKPQQEEANPWKRKLVEKLEEILAGLREV